MGSGDYFAPVKYEPPPKKRFTMPSWFWFVLGLIAVGILGALGLLYALNWYGRRAMQAHLPPAGVKVGQRLTWRELAKHGAWLPTMPGALGGLFADDFDADGDEEILRIAYTGDSFVYEVDGTVSRVPISGKEFMMGGVSWDYDRDGVAEVVVETMLGDILGNTRRGSQNVEDISWSQSLPVYNLSGGAVTKLPAVASMPDSMLTGDFDGDGYAELLAKAPDPQSDYGANTWLAFGLNGKQVWQVSPGGEMFVKKVAGDIDGDGKDEVLYFTNRLKTLCAIGMEQEQVTITDWHLPTRVFPHSCADLTDDGVAEVIAPVKGFFNPAIGAFITFHMPAGADEAFKMASHVVTGDFDGDGELEVAHGGLLASGVLIMEATGHCMYYEEFGDWNYGLVACRAGGIDYIVVQLKDRLLIYP